MHIEKNIKKKLSNIYKKRRKRGGVALEFLFFFKIEKKKKKMPEAPQSDTALKGVKVVELYKAIWNKWDRYILFVGYVKRETFKKKKAFIEPFI